MPLAQATSINFSIPAMQAWKKIPEGVHAEVMNEKLYVSPSGTRYHGMVINDIHFELSQYVRARKLGEVYCTSIDIFLNKGSVVVVPDIFFVSSSNKGVTASKKGYHGPIDLAIEVLSPGTGKRDITIKKSIYEQAGVREYWIVDPDTKDTWGYLLENNSYNKPLRLNAKLHIRILNKKIRF